MEHRNKLPEDDPDRQLARLIGQALENDMELSGTESPLLEMLFEYKQKKQVKSPDATGREVWKSIEDSMKGPSGSSSRFTQITVRPMLRAAAAIVLIAAVIGILYLQFSSQSSLIAESGSAPYSITLEDGSEVTLRPWSKFHALEEPGRYRLEGEARFEVAYHPGREFSVEAGGGRVTVLGTAFVLSDWGAVTRVYLEEGSLQFETVGRTDSVILEPGQFSTLSAGELLEPSFSDRAEYTDWLRNEMVFDNRPARMVFNELEQHFRLSVSAPDSVMDMRISGTLVLGSEAETLESLGIVLGGRFIPTGTSAYRFSPD